MSETVHTVTQKQRESDFHADISGDFSLDESVIAGKQAREGNSPV